MRGKKISWCSDDLLRYMAVRPEFYGDQWQHISSADHSYLAKCFTDSVLTNLDLSSIVALPFAKIKYCGKGDPCGVLIDPDYCFTDDQITSIMNHLCIHDCDDRFHFALSDYVSFQIEMFLLYSVPIYKNWIHSFRVSASKGDI